MNVLPFPFLPVPSTLAPIAAASSLAPGSLPVCLAGVRPLWSIALAGILIAVSARPAAAQAPAPGAVSEHASARGSVELVVPFAPNGPTDTVAQALAAALAEQLRYPVVVRNVAGAGGTAGAASVARAAPDG